MFIRRVLRRENQEEEIDVFRVKAVKIDAVPLANCDSADNFINAVNLRVRHGEAMSKTCSTERFAIEDGFDDGCGVLLFEVSRLN